MEKSASYTIVGTFCLLLLAGLVVFATWLANFQLARDYTIYDLRFDGPVRGLSLGSDVNFNGIKVGQITKVVLDPGNPSMVIAEARLTSGVPIKRDSYGTLEPQGVTGVNYVQITAGSAASPLLIAGARSGTIPTIATRRSTLDDIFDGGGTAMTHVVVALDRVNQVLSDDNISAFSQALLDARDLLDALNMHKGLIDDAEKTIRDADAAAVELLALEKSGRGLVDVDAKRVLRSITDAADELLALEKSGHGLLDGDAHRALRSASDAADDVSATAQTLQSVSETLEQLLVEFQSSPREALGKPTPAGLDVKP